MTHGLKTFAALAATGLLMACDGSGGADFGSPLGGRAVTTATVVDSSGNLSIGSPSSSNPVTVSLSTDDGRPVALEIDASSNNPSSVVRFDVAQGDTVQVGPLTTTFRSQDGREFAVIVNPEAVGFEHQSLGAWGNTIAVSNGTLGVASYGDTTPSASIPAEGTSASYSGLSLGFAEVGGTSFATESGVQVNTPDFKSVTMVSTGTIGSPLNAGSSGAVDLSSSLDFGSTGTISGNGFQTTINTTGLTGSVDGRFYGPDAEEVGGTFRATGSGINYFGAFGANQ
ncbi:transferrin-binding protein-like solute binding protein [Tropicimonas sp. S265A]|uniref:transferrin-binding protein-like solute binding protein n=1 Tax=Tropicimonas sp. S265A TaxID=3415134 RepID=UPI003C7E3A04